MRGKILPCFPSSLLEFSILLRRIGEAEDSAIRRRPRAEKPSSLRKITLDSYYARCAKRGALGLVRRELRLKSCAEFLDISAERNHATLDRFDAIVDASCNDAVQSSFVIPLTIPLFIYIRKVEKVEKEI
jgi:hypothetical protein